ncbi:MAG: AAA family ATPase, partial [Cyanobacteria bacterium NC_groundwater_1444_Ag_S-0.65um_54_12]|nr:AAA family ATPase [Cyanobacteria bacterium NC_groundwater_1444_Ag_S-0.65um_54_12]
MSVRDTELTLQLRVREALTKDVGRGLVRCDPVDLQRLAVGVADVVILQGKQRAVARVMPAYPEQRGQGIIQLDGILRENAGVGLDDKVTVQLVQAKDAKTLTLAPASSGSAAFRDGELRYLAHLLAGIPVLTGNRVRVSPFGARPRDFMVTDTMPTGAVVITMETRIQIKGEKSVAEIPDRISYEDVGGLQREIQRIREMIELPLKHPEVFERLGIDPPRGVLLQGPPGCGKTLIARAVAHETEAAFFTVSGPEVVHKFYGESEAHLREIFEKATRSAPSIIFIDEIDAIAPKREELGGEKQVERRVVAQLLALMDGLQSRGQVIVIAATNLPNVLDPALRRPGRFDRELAIGIPNSRGRLEIIQIHTQGMPLAEDVSLEKIAALTHGFVGADLEALCREAAMHALRHFLPKIDFAWNTIPADELLALQVSMNDFVQAFKEIEPSGLREVAVEIPDVHWNQVGGLADIQRLLRETVEWPLLYPELLKQMGTRPVRGILLYGPPGTGKTLLARAVATEAQVNFIAINGPALISKFVGESERALREVFQFRQHQSTTSW